MRQYEVVPYYKKCTEALSEIYEYMLKQMEIEKSVKELCKMRGYFEGSPQQKLLYELKIGTCSFGDTDDKINEAEEMLGLTTATGRFLLDERFIIPVRDICGNLVTLIGYYPDIKKYITLPTPYFSKDILYFNIDDAFRRSWTDYDGIVFLVEGIFDCLSLRSIGLPAIATMGSTVSKLKSEVLKQFKKVIYIPDNDATGRIALDRFNPRGWQVPSNATGIKLKGYIDYNTVAVGEEGYNEDLVIKVKDIDNLISWFETEDVINILLDLSESTKLIEVLEV